MAREANITTEYLAELVTSKGLAAAKQAIADNQAKLQAAVAKINSDIKQLEAQRQETEQRLSQLATMMAGAVKKASNDAGIQLAQPAVKAAPVVEAAGRRSRQQADADRTALLNMIPADKTKALSIGELIQQTGRSDSEVKQDLLKIRKQLSTIGNKRDTRYYRTK